MFGHYPLFSFFLKCCSCEGNFAPVEDASTFPLCRNCAQSLRPAPPLCKQCGGTHCHSSRSCQRPWTHHPEIESYSSRYLLFPQGYAVLRNWKIRRGTLYDQQILTPYVPLREIWEKFDAEAIVPLPQHSLRAWQMGGSRSEQIARWVSHETKLPLVNLMEAMPVARGTPRQAELKLEQRLSHARIFSLLAGVTIPKRIILVDDFMTTGHTLRQVSRQLSEWGVDRVHAFCLGVRPTQFNVR